MSAALALPTAAHATDPVPLEGAYVVDYVGVIGNQSDAVMGSLDSLADAGINLFVVVVDRFTGVGTNDSWAAATADLNRMGDRDVLFAIATVDRNFDFSYPDDLSLSEAETDRLENDVAVPLLRNNDYVGAIIAYADAMRAELTGTPVGPSDAGGGGIPINWPIVGGVVAVGGGALYLYSRSRKKKAVAADKLSQKELDTRAGVLLVQLDDQLKTSEQDLSFALA
ncbi:MAG TPA: TPM domain-containing protein, partial [Terrimesophilobacter sp.]|nr:TPM domain-containing protein [Terrimesophilobacter sp.]